MRKWQSEFAKPEPRRREKGRRERAEQNVKDSVRTEVAERDGYCRLLGGPFGACDGRSTWNHLKRRSATVGQAPERRHSTRTSIMNCQRHHRMLDEHEISWSYRTALEADGLIRFWRDDDGVVL